jgi:hypothetical protein
MKNRVNKQIIKALSVGLAASMALQPVTAFADEGEPVAPAQDPVESVPATEVVQQDVANGPADVAQAAADVVSHEAPAPSVETPVVEGDAEAEVKPVDKGGDLQVTESDADIVTDDIADTAKAGEAGVDITITAEVDFEIGKRPDVDISVEKKDYSQDVINAAKNLADNTNNIADAEPEIDSVKKDLIIAENADVASDKAVDAAADTMADIQKKTEDVEQTVNQAVETANTLADNIKNATSVADAQKAYDDLTNLASDTADAVDTYNKALYGEDGNGGLMAKYEAARKVLENAQNRFDAAIGEYSDEENAGTGARGSVEAAEAKVAAAEKEVEALKTAIKDAKDNIETINKAALEIAWLQEDIKKDVAKGVAVSDKQDVLFEKVMKSYYAKEMLPFGANDINVSKSENGYFAVSYRDVLGFKHDPLYFNYGSNDKGDFIMYPKTEVEVKALDALAAYVKDHPDVSEENKTVYAITKFGEKTVYKVYDEIKDDLVKVGNDYYLKSGNGTTKTLVEAVAAPDSIDDIANVGDDAQAVSLANQRTVYTIDGSGNLYKTTYADVTTETYEKFQTKVAEYLNERYSDNDKDKALAAFKEENPDITITSVVNKDKTFYVVSGQYIPSFVLTLDENTEIIKRKDTGKHGRKQDNAKKQAINETLSDVKKGLKNGYHVVDNDLSAEIISLLDYYDGDENIYITGTITVSKNNVKSVEVSSDECESLEDAIASLESNKSSIFVDENAPQTAKISYLYHVPFTLIEEKGVEEVPFEQVPVLNGEISSNSYDKYSYCIEYITKTAESVKEGQMISRTTYTNVKNAYQILQDGFKNSRFALNVDQDKKLNDILDQAMELFDKYDRYSKEAAQVQADIDKTQEDIDTLEEAIDDLSAKHGNKTAREVLVDVDDFADYFKVSDDFIMEYFSDEPWEEIKSQGDEALKEKIDGYKDSLKDMTVDEFTKFLDALKDAAEAKKGEIESLLKVVQKQRDDSQNDLNDTINRLTPPSSDDDDDTTGGGDDTTGGGDGTTTFIPVAVTPATNVVAPAADNAQAPAVLGARTTRRSSAKAAADTETVATDNSNGNGGNDNSAVAGAQKEETKTPEAPKTETTIEETETALAATPELEEKGFAWWWLLILAAIAGVSVEEYARRKSNKAKAEAKDSTKINK